MMCKAFNEKPEHCLRNKSTQKYIDALTKTQIWVLTDYQEVTSRYGGDENGTWVDQKLILNLAQWLNPVFAIWCNDKISELMRTGTTSIQKKLILVY